MDKIATFLDMGGRAQFVWPAYGLTALVLIVLLIVSLKAVRARDRELDGIEGRRRKRERER